MRSATIFGLLVCGLAQACAGTQAGRTTTPVTQTPPPARNVQGEGFRIVGTPTGQGGDAYDATMLFERANTAVETNRCDAALPDYERLVREFPDSRLVGPANYNRGVCLQSAGRWDDATAAFRAAVQASQDPTLQHDAWFRIAAVGEAAQRPPAVLEATQSLLDSGRLNIPDRIEALARRGAAQLAANDLEGATRTANQAIELAPSRESVSALGNDTYIAQARFLAGEITRQQASAVVIRVEDAELERAIERRVMLVTHAHVQFNDAIRVGNPHWAAASGFSIGEAYRSLYDSIVNAQTPADWDANAVQIYRQRTGARLRILLTGALRAWEATQDMARRNGIGDNAWVRRTEEQIASLRQLILDSASQGSRGASASNAPNTPAPPRR